MVHEGKKDYKCKHCGNEYFEKRRLDGHIKREHDNVRDEKCNQCGKLYFTKEILTRHIKNVHKNFPCLKCDEAFPTNSNLVEHVNMKHANEVEHDTTTNDQDVKKHIRAGKIFLIFLKYLYYSVIIFC